MPLSPVVPVGTAHYAQAVPGHNRWHPDIPAVAEVISGGSVRMECQGRSEAGDDDDPASDVLLCGPIAILGAEPGDILVIDVIGVGRGGHRDPLAHPGIIGCAPSIEAVAAAAAAAAAGRRSMGSVGSVGTVGALGNVGTVGTVGPVRSKAEPAHAERGGVLLGHVRPGLPDYPRIAAQAVGSAARGKEVAWCAVAPLAAGSRALLPVHARGAKLSVGDLHFPARRAAGADGDENANGNGSGNADQNCGGTGGAGWIDLRINLTKRGMERFRVSGPMLMSEPAGP